MLEKLNKKADKYQPLINTVGIFLAVIGIYFTFLQTIQTNNELRRSNYKFNAEQLPTAKFETLDKKLGILRVSFLQSDMLLQLCRVTHHDSLIGGHQEMIRMHDSIWFNSALFSYFKWDEKINNKFQDLMKKNKFNSYVNLRTPVLLEFNYIKYGESRIVNGIFELEFSYFKDYRNDPEKFESEIRAVYFKKYIEFDELKKNPLKKLKMFEIINGA